MDIKAIAEQVAGALGEAPEKLQELASDPKGAIEGLTGHALEDADIPELLGHVKGMMGEGFDLSALGDIGEHLGDLLEKSPLGDLGDMLGGLLGKEK